MFLPSRPMIRPFISSEGSWTTETVVAAVCSAAMRWIASEMIFLASRSAVRCASSLISRMLLAATARASSCRSSISFFLASWAVIPASASKRRRTSWAIRSTSAVRAATAPSPWSSSWARRSWSCSRSFRASNLWSSDSVRSTSRRSSRSTSSRRRVSSCSKASRRRTASSLPSSSCERLRFSASSLARWRMMEASSLAATFSRSRRVRSRLWAKRKPERAPMARPTTAASVRPSGSMYHSVNGRSGRGVRGGPLWATQRGWVRGPLTGSP